MKRSPIVTLSAVLCLLAGLAFLPACGAGVKEAQAARSGQDTDDTLDTDDQAFDQEQDAEEMDQDSEESDSYEVPPTPAPPAPKPAARVPARPSASVAPPIRTVRLTVPSQTPMNVEFASPLSSETSQVGDPFTARIAEDIVVNGQVAIPAGSEVSGVVTEAVASKKIGGQARLAIQFDSIQLPSGDSAPFNAAFIAEGKKQTKKDAATIGGSAAGGALLGRVLSKDAKRGTAVGAVVGAAVGTAIAAGNEGDPVNIGEGAVLPITTQDSLVVVIEGNSRRFDGATANR